MQARHLPINGHPKPNLEDSSSLVTGGPTRDREETKLSISDMQCMRRALSCRGSGERIRYSGGVRWQRSPRASSGCVGFDDIRVQRAQEVDCSAPTASRPQPHLDGTCAQRRRRLMPYRTLAFLFSFKGCAASAKARSQELDVNALVHLLKVGYISQISKVCCLKPQTNQKTPWYGYVRLHVATILSHRFHGLGRRVSASWRV